MANAFSKEEIVAFENILEGFHDALILSKNINIYNTNGVTMERARDTMWRPQPYIAQSFTRTVGTTIASNVQTMTQLSVPSTLGFSPCSAWEMNALELRDALQENRLGDAAKQKLASDINLSVMDLAAAQGTLVVDVATAAGDYDDIALCDSIMNEQGVMAGDRYLALSSRDYNGMAGNLAISTRSFTGNKSANAYERSFVGEVASFETYKLDYANRCNANSASRTIATNGAQVRYVPKATVTNVGGVLNVDNRYQTVTVSSTTGVLAGDAFTIDGIEAVHHITKRSTGQLKTFRVIEIVDGTSMVISPPIIGANSAPTDAEQQYQNVEVVSTSATAPINFLNIAASSINPFWRKDSIELLPGRYAVPDGAGVDVLRASTDQGIELVMTKKFDPLTFQTLYTLDTLYGVVMTNPEMSGILLFNQT
jgi:P22 coat protein - gene protein 5